MNPSQVFFGESLISGVLPRKKPMRGRRIGYFGDGRTLYDIMYQRDRP